MFVEIYTNENPFYPHTFNFLLEFLEKLKSREIFPNIPNPKQHKIPPLFVGMLKQMLSFEPDERPSASQILRCLKDKKMDKQLRELLNLEKIPESIRFAKTNSKIIN